MESAVTAVSAGAGGASEREGLGPGGNERSGSLDQGLGGHYSGLKGRGQLDFANRAMVVVVVGYRAEGMTMAGTAPTLRFLEASPLPCILE